ncbi:MAG TPA: site-2 protease family protein [Longimicrobium sp.]|nr:site-2 protease family protein [Longimicrobium sp.]
MRWSLRVARMGATEIKIHLTFVLLLALVAVAYAADGGAAAAVDAVLFVLLLFGSVLLHELGHVAAARRYGIDTPDITLLPIGGVARMRRLPRDPRQELVVSLAGPAVTLAIAAASFALARAGTPGGMLRPDAEPWRVLADRFFTANVVLLVFNLLPAFPMDGGRVLRALLALRMDYVRATRAAAAVGQGFAALFGLAGLLVSPLLVVIAVFVYVGARQEAAAAEVQETAAGLPVSAAMMTDFRVLRPESTLGGAAALLLASGQRDFPVVDDEGWMCGVLTRAGLLRGLARHGGGASVETAMEAGPAGLSPESGLAEAFQRMQDAPAPLVPVADANGTLLGVLTPENLAEMVILRGAMARAGRARARGTGEAALAQAGAGTISR